MTRLFSPHGSLWRQRKCVLCKFFGIFTKAGIVEKEINQKISPSFDDLIEGGNLVDVKCLTVFFQIGEKIIPFDVIEKCLPDCRRVVDIVNKKINDFPAFFQTALFGGIPMKRSGNFSVKYGSAERGTF